MLQVQERAPFSSIPFCATSASARAPLCGSESPRLRNAEVLASWRQLGGAGEVLPRQTELVEGRALRLGERSVREAGYEGMIGRTLAEEERFCGYEEIGPDFQTVGRCCVLVRH
jgi:hypothetical protein